MIDEINKQVDDFEQLRRNIQENLKDALEPILQKTLVENVEAIKWNQYTPYFNDGDSCEFTIGELLFKPSEKLLKMHPEFFEYPHDSEGGYYEGCLIDYLDKKSPELLTALMAVDSLNGLIRSLEEFMESVYGNHITVEVTKDGYSIEEYEHD